VNITKQINLTLFKIVSLEHEMNFNFSVKYKNN